MQGPSTSSPRTPLGDMELYSHDQIVSIAKKNQRAQQQKKRTQQKPQVTTKGQQPRQHTSPRRPKQHTMPQKETKSKDAGKRRFKQNANDTFLAKSRATALQQSKLHMEKQKNRSFIQINQGEMIKSPTIEKITLSDSTQNSPIKVFTSNNKYDFMITSPESPDILTNFTSAILTPKIDKAVKKIQEKLNATPMSSNSPIENNAVPYGITQIEQATSNNTKTSDSATDIAQTSSPKAETSKKQSMEDEPKGAQDHDPNEEDFAVSISPGKSSISHIKPGDFYDEEFHD